MSLGLLSLQAERTELSRSKAEIWVSLAARLLLLGLLEHVEDGEGGRESATGVFDCELYVKSTAESTSYKGVFITGNGGLSDASIGGRG